ncbi:MAG TPA: phosphatidate cytidylyltransferase [Spirochaetota bacterium]|nr:phosphatidate cytidylyltransferase [Spirochaetota bacterium]HOM37728.1 phosphatidate cytidylyltransferase [Spirochaetota bacterium]HPQ49686.1 phosphatidate cytidylyltransferase [Spirochaetota bacterium]
MSETLKRIVMTILFLPVLYFSFVEDKSIIFSFLVSIISIIGSVELYLIFKNKDYKINLWFLIPAIIVIDYFFYKRNFESLIIVFLILFIIEVFLLVFKKDFLNSLIVLSLTIFSLIYVGVMPASLIIVRQVSYQLLITLISFTWFCDIGAYFIGKYFGKNKLGLPISPHKTIEGFIGGVITSIIFGILTAYIFNVELKFYFFFIPFLTIIGDLFESLIKRAFSVKDSSHLIPGHGGILDAFDSLIFTGSIIFIITLIKV